MAKPDKTDPGSADSSAATTAANSPVPPPEEQLASARLEVVSVTEEDLPCPETPNTLNVSPLGTPPISPLPRKDPETAPPNTMPITKVQPFMIDEDFGEKKWKSWLLAHNMKLLIGLCVVVTITVILGLGLGVGLNCTGKFRCGSSLQCISMSQQCDGNTDCGGGEDELGCVRLSGSSSVLQLQSAGIWRTICSDGWNDVLGLAGCRQLGYSRYLSSQAINVSSVEEDYQSNLVSIILVPTWTGTIKLQNTSNLRNQCNSGKVTSLQCLACGTRPLHQAPAGASRIVGGNQSQPGQFPWQASLRYKQDHVCGGSIVSTYWLVTAAHCVYGNAHPEDWSVLVGTVDQPVNGAKALTLDKIICHEEYRQSTMDHDIALMKLSQPLVFIGSVQPICLPNFGEEFADGTMCWISGWGATENNGESTVHMNAAQVPLISSQTCNQPEVYHGLINSWMLCAGYLEGGIDSCQGDSGGPLACQDKALWKLVGATSWGEGCALKDKPGVYTRITWVLPWIRQQMEKEEAMLPAVIIKH